MSKIAVVYWSGTGNTQAMAEAVVQGAKDKGAEVTLFTAAEFGPTQMDQFDGFAFGCPSMGAEVLEEGEFEPMFESVEGKLSGKKVALFGSYGWGDGQWMRDWTERCESRGANLTTEAVICTGAPEPDTEADLKSLGGSLV